ncbi:serine hydrolase domain-containing protein [Chitinophaga sp.]|uniref:serine hydrolase domain-containing protein n=1 Tax=Chitinophaga sp. TaxID=1869181 RepID=UPI0031DACBBD
MKLTNYLLIVCTFLPILVYPQKPLLDSLLADKHIAGFEAVAIDKGHIVWTGYYGYQNLEKKIPVGPNTLFEAASTSKTVTAAAVMQLYAAGKFKLDDDVNRYLDFHLANPAFPHTPITFRQLLRHRASIDDNVDYLHIFWDTNHGDPTIPLSVFIKEYFKVQGKHYDKQKNFYDYPPGAKAHYSNMGIALLGYLVERISGQDFNTYCKIHLFQPLDMHNTGWFLRDIDSNQVAMPYTYSDSLHQFIPLGHGGFPDYPAGGLHTNVEQFAHFLIAWTNQGRWSNRHVIDSNAIQTLTPDECNLGFHTWFQFATNKGLILYSHTGSAIGVSSFISYSPLSKKGVIFICNGEFENAQAWKDVINTLYSQAFK